mmetsp:Transcript_13928/g.54970  ORF Transcript_13928/g.54970 Transcript_13928/m.54970 type:complete len:262 (-) Transcript_13928:1608-2393(-)
MEAGLLVTAYIISAAPFAATWSFRLGPGSSSSSAAATSDPAAGSAMNFSIIWMNWLTSSERCEENSSRCSRCSSSCLVVVFVADDAASVPRLEDDATGPETELIREEDDSRVDSERRDPPLFFRGDLSSSPLLELPAAGSLLLRLPPRRMWSSDSEAVTAGAGACAAALPFMLSRSAVETVAPSPPPFLSWLRRSAGASVLALPSSPSTLLLLLREERTKGSDWNTSSMLFSPPPHTKNLKFLNDMAVCVARGSGAGWPVS